MRFLTVLKEALLLLLSSLFLFLAWKHERKMFQLEQKMCQGTISVQRNKKYAREQKMRSGNKKFSLWQIMVLNFCMWSYMPSCGHIWPCMALYGLVWPCIKFLRFFTRLQSEWKSAEISKPTYFFRHSRRSSSLFPLLKNKDPWETCFWFCVICENYNYSVKSHDVKNNEFYCDTVSRFINQHCICMLFNMEIRIIDISLKKKGYLECSIAKSGLRMRISSKIFWESMR